MNFRAVIFDLFGTLVDNVPTGAYSAWLGEMASVLDVEPAAFVAAWQAPAQSRKRILGTHWTPERSVEAVCAVLGVTPDRRRKARAADMRSQLYRRWLTPRPGALETLDALGDRGLRRGLLTGCSCEVPLLWGRSAFAGRFDVAMFSCWENLDKPDARLYQRMSARLGVAADRCLYVGDGANEELAGARKAGMRAVLLRAPHEYDVVMARKGVAEWDGPVIEHPREAPALLDDV